MIKKKHRPVDHVFPACSTAQHLTLNHSAMAKEYDIVLYGATGFTGKLATSYLASQYGATIKVRRGTIRLRTR